MATNKNYNIRANGLNAIIRKIAQEEIEASNLDGGGDGDNGGGGGSEFMADDITQEALTAENISGTDTILTDTLSIPPKDADGVAFYLNGQLQAQGSGADYELVGNLTQIRWLAGSGTAVDMEESDTILVVYEIYT